MLTTPAVVLTKEMTAGTVVNTKPTADIVSPSDSDEEAVIIAPEGYWAARSSRIAQRTANSSRQSSPIGGLPVTESLAGHSSDGEVSSRRHYSPQLVN